MFNLESLSDRTKKIVGQIGLNVLYKGGSILISFFFVPLSIRYLGSSNYGVWLTLFSFLAFFNFFDFGLGHGLRNYLTPLLNKKKYKTARIYVSTAYFSLLLMSCFFLILFFLVFNLINWQSFFKITNNDLESFLILVKLLFIVFFTNFTLKLIDTIFYAYLRPSVPGLLSFLNNSISFGIVYLLLYFNEKSLLLYGATILFVQFSVFLIANVLVFTTRLRAIRPSVFLFNKVYAKQVFNLGGKFLLLQMAALVLYSTDNIIIAKLFSTKDVTTYNIAYKYFSVFTMFSSLILAPLWSAITEAHSSNDISWIKEIVRKSNKLIIVLSLLVFISLFLSDFAYELWVGKGVIIPNLLSWIMSFYVITAMFLQIYSMYLNGVGVIKIQLLVGVFCALINIPLSVLLSSYFNLGISGVISATLICNIISLFFLPYQYNIHIKGKAIGIWNK